MTKQNRIDMEHEAEAYAEKYKTASPQEQSLIALAYLDGLKHGLKQHAHDYLVKTIELKRKHEEKIADLEKENERLTVSYETLKLHDEEEIGMLKSRVAELEQQIEKMKCCKICKHNGIKTCQYDNGIKDCLENGRKLFELKEIEK